MRLTARNEIMMSADGALCAGRERTFVGSSGASTRGAGATLAGVATTRTKSLAVPSIAGGGSSSPIAPREVNPKPAAVVPVSRKTLSRALARGW
jgi:hypothetical protein